MHSPPAWSMGKSQRGSWKPSGQPGPGSYNPQPKNKPRPLGGKQGTASRDIKRRNSVPGPGSYNSPGKITSKSPEYSIAKKYPSNLKSTSPGPGAYEGTGQRGYDTTSPAYSFRVKPAESGKEKGPGPGAYEPTSKIQNLASPSYKMGTSQRDDFYQKSVAPGPGTYSAARPGSAGPKFGFGTADRSEKPRNGSPGPGAYDFKGFFEEGDGKGTTLVPRRTDRPSTAKVPGPGAYDPKLSTKQSAPAYRMGSARRGSSAEKSGAPGPGNYDPKPVKGYQNIKIGTSVRSPLSESVKTPGPGAYDFRSKVGEGPRFSMKPRRDERGNESAPGPGAYEANSKIRNAASPSFKMGTSTRDGFYRTSDAPGPGSYSTRPNSAFNKDSGPKYGFGSATRDELQAMSKTLPGPGSYDFKSDFGDDKGTTLVPRRERPNTAQGPGPGAYDPSLSTKNRGPAFKMGSAPRDGPRQRSGTPGPGNYDPQLMRGSQTVRIGTSVRSPLSESGKTPGPGSYEYASKVGEGPRFSMKPRRDDRYNEYAPGPGAYDATSRVLNLSSPSYKMGTATRDDFYKTGDAPGPGAYTTRPNSAAGPKFGFGTSERDPLYGMSKTLPGPGSYEHKGAFDENKGTTLVPRRPDSALNAAARSPGPGAYDPSLSTKNSAPAYRMGSAQRDSPVKGGAPGPGNYDPKLWEKGQNVKIGTSVRSPLSASGKNPGPGTYDYDTKLGEGPKFTMNPRREKRVDEFAPGPGAYEATSRIQNMASPSYKIGTSSRDDFYRNTNAPGPGAYGTRPDSAGPKFGFGTAERDPLHGMSKTLPGPGSYDMRSAFEEEGRGTTLVPRRGDQALKSASKSPGPGQYNPSLYTKDQAPAYGMGSAPRDSPTKGGAPGPGNYDPKLWEKGQNIKIGTSVRSPLSGSGKNPGPGTYDYGSKVGEGPQFTMNPRRDQKYDRFVPGPGAYEATSRIQNVSSPSYKIGTSSRDDLYRGRDAPGPGAYTTRPDSAFNRDSGPKHVFGTADRDALHGMSKTMPGPGAYEHGSVFEGDGKGVSMVPRRPESGMVRSPGPGAYNPNLYTKDQAPAYRMGSAPRDSPTKGGAPGPGNYEPRLVQSGQNIKIGTSVRSPLHGNQKTPGPGTYESPTKVGQGPKYIMNPRREEKYERYVPGPGAYSPSVELVKDNNPAPRMGTSTREDLHPTRANPGPGQYDTRGNAGGPKWGFGSEVRSPNPKVSGPGPGAYEQKTRIGDVPKYAYGNAPLKIHL